MDAIKNIFLTLFVLVVSLFAFNSNILANGGGPVTECIDALPFCTDGEFLFPNETNTSSPSGPNYGTCPAISNGLDNPVWYFMEISESGPIEITLEQYSQPNGAGTQLDLDFVMWGPYPSFPEACSQIMAGDPPIQVSYDPSYQEVVGIGVQGGTDTWCPGSPYGPTTPPAAQEGEVYVLMISNPSGSSGYVTFEQTGGTGSTDCAIVEDCSILDFTADLSECVNDKYSVSGTITVSDPPDSGSLTVEDCNGNSTIIATAPFTSTTYTYQLNDLTANGVDCSVKVSFTDAICHETIDYTAPIACSCNQPTLVIHDINECSSETIDISTAVVSGGFSANLTYYSNQSNANSGTSAINPNVTTGGTYWVRAEAIGEPSCFSVYQINVSITNITYTVTTEAPTCGDSNGSITIIATGGEAPYQYQMTINGQAQTNATGVFSNLSAGNYSFTITGDDGCEVSGNQYLGGEGDGENPYFEFNDFCEGDVNGPTNISSQGGIFSFETQPTDGASINSATGMISGGVGGASYTVEYTVGEICPSSHTVVVSVNSIPAPSFDADVLSGCRPLKVTFTNTSGFTGSDCLWTFGDGSTSTNCTNAIHTYTSSGTYSVSLTLTDNIGCSNSVTYSDYIDVLKGPTAGFTADPEITTSENTTVNFFNSSTDATDFLWDFGDGSPTSTGTHVTHIFPEDKDGEFIVTLIASDGNTACDDTVKLVIQVREDLIFYVPNAFTPDKDSYNEMFKPIFHSGFDPYSYSLTIFNRWGEVMFESFNVDYGWDGSYGGAGIAQEGIYVWKIKVKESYDDKHYEFVGHVNLLK